MTELVGMPDFDYQSHGPWFVSHEQPDGTVKVGQVHALLSAVIRLWHMSQGCPRFVIFDGRGTVILGVNNHHDLGPYMVGTREALDATLKMCSEASDPSSIIPVLELVANLTDCGGSIW